MPRKFRADRRYRLFDWRTALLEDQSLQPNTRLVGLVLSLHMNKAGESCFPGLQLLQDQTGLGRSAVSDHIRRLDERGWIDRRPNPGRSKVTEYVATFPPDVVDEIIDGAKLAAEAPVKGPAGRTVSPGEGSAGADGSEVSKGSAGEDESGKDPPGRAGLSIEGGRADGLLRNPAANWLGPIADAHLEIMGAPLNCARWAKTFSSLAAFVATHYPVEVLGTEPDAISRKIAIHVSHYAQHLIDTGRAEFLDYGKMAESFAQWAQPWRDPKRPTQHLKGKTYGDGRFSQKRNT